MKIDSTYKQILKTICRSMEDKMAENPLILNIEKLTTMASFLIICNGENPRQNKAISDLIADDLAKIKVKPMHKEGAAGSGWLLLDYGDLIIHVFMPETRKFYDLEGLWADAPRVKIESI
jgi:ribosome-associated protein